MLTLNVGRVVKAWDWMTAIHLIGGPSGYSVYDGTDTSNNCTTLNRQPWTYSYGMLLNAAAVMWNVTGDQLWETRTMGIWQASAVSDAYPMRRKARLEG